MADTTTALGLVKIEVGASQNTWGGKINDNMDRIQDLCDGTTAITPQISGGTITGVTALRGPNGSAASPGLTFSAQTDMGIYNSTSNVMGIATAGVMRATVSATALTVAVPVYAAVGTTTVPSIAGSGDTNTGITFLESDRLLFLTGGVERARFNNGGTLLIAQTTLTNPGVGSTTEGHALTPEGRLHASAADTYAASFNVNANDTLVTLRRSGTAVGSISVTTTATTYNTSSARALKENIDDLELDSGALVDALKPRSFNWKASGQRSHGFIADEFGEVFGQSVTLDGNGLAIEIDPSTPEVVAVLVAEVQNLRRRLSALEAL